jgi:prolyl 4-hydroxylase
MPKNEKWCEFLECKEDSKTNGVTFRARKGNAIFWMNFDPEGRGYKEVIHAGMPVTKGTKVGLNVWSWFQKGHMAPS